MRRASQSTAPPPNPPTNNPLVLTFSASPFQEDWRGLCANYAGIPAQAAFGLSPTELTAEWDRVALSGCKVLSTWYDESWAMPTYPTGSPNWTSSDMTAFYAFLAAMKSRGVKVMIKMGWHYPQNVGALSGTAPITPTPANEATFAAWVSESLNQFLNVRSYDNVIGCFFFTEPSNNQVGNIPGGYTATEYYVHVLDVVQAKIVSDDGGRTPIRPRVVLAGPSTQSFVSDATWIEAVADSGLADGISDHDYCNFPYFPPYGLVAAQCSGYQEWIDVFTTRVDEVSPLPLAADESGFLVGGDSDSTGYRATADAGWQWIRQVDGHMQAGCQSSYIWLLEDQPILGGSVLEYGAMKWMPLEGNTVKPSWYAVSMHANLTGGGGGTSLYRCTGGGASLHGTAAFVPFGVKNAVNEAGEWSFVVINESVSLDIQLNLGVSLGGRTVYRYAYSGEYVPVTASNPAYLLPWSKSYANVTTAIPADHIPGRSIVIYSTMNISAPTAENLALTATASTNAAVSYGMPSNVNQGNPSNVIGTTNGWRKLVADPQRLRLLWDTPVTIGRLELSFVATTAGVVYADYATTGTPSPLADYTVQYWNGSTYVDFSTPIDVTGNSDPNRTHTFTPVSTTRIRLTAISAAATAQVNNIGVYAS